MAICPARKRFWRWPLPYGRILTRHKMLLACAGYALSHGVKFDVIVEFFIVHEMFDVFTINEMLFRYEQPLLGQ